MMKKSLILTLVIFGISVINISAQTESNIKTITKGVVNGLATNLPKPDFPPAAKAVGAVGAVNVQVLIDENGNVLKAVAVSGHPLLRGAAEQAAQAAKFKPIMLGGEAVRAKGVIVYNFVPSELKNNNAQSAGNIPVMRGTETEVSGETTQIKGTVLNDSAINLVKPEYPSAAKAVRASGAVNVRVLLDENGNVAKAEAVSGHPLLRAAAVDAALQSKFKPTTLDGQPVKVEGVVVYNFVP